MVDGMDSWQTQSYNVQILANSADSGIYKVVNEDIGNGKQAEKELTVSLVAGQEYAWVDYRITNTGSEAWTYVQDPSHVHQGAHIGTVRPRKKQTLRHTSTVLA